MVRIADSAEDLAGVLAALPAAGRQIVAIAGPPGSGKSTLAEDLVSRLEQRKPGHAAVIPMDGFHLDDGVLKARGTLARKGAPFTFDIGGLTAMLHRLRANAEDEIFVPVFDRTLEISRAGARAVPRALPLLIVEGNYLLLDQPGWRDLRPLFDLTVSLDVPLAVLEQRLVQRWTGFGFSPEAALARARENDLANAGTVSENSACADIIFRSC